jgi:hypothetical protein
VKAAQRLRKSLSEHASMWPLGQRTIQSPATDVNQPCGVRMANFTLDVPPFSMRALPSWSASTIHCGSSHCLVFPVQRKASTVSWPWR